MADNSFIWSDGWWIENKYAWFISGYHNILFQYNMDTKECNFIVKLPVDGKDEFRMNTKCIKVEDEIFCMPDRGNSIYVYNLSSSNLLQIRINNPDRKRISLFDFWQFNNKIYAVSIGLKKVIEIDIRKKIIENYYSLDTKADEVIGMSIRVKESIYTLSPMENKIYVFNTISKENFVYTLPTIKEKLHTLCYDDGNFWLSGYSKRIFLWKQENNTVKIINTFPAKFGIYNFMQEDTSFLNCDKEEYETPIFSNTLISDKYIWCIPFQTNKIIYINRTTCEMFELDIQEEIETKESIVRRELAHKYILEFVIDNRYIGLFSLKANKILIIDSKDKKSQYLELKIDDKCLNAIGNVDNESNSYFTEKSFISRKIYTRKIYASYTGNRRENLINIGKIIHKNIFYK